MGDFTGFTFGNIHSSELGIIRVSGGDRYEGGVHPEIKNKTVEVPGLNGEYYFGSDYGTRVFDLEIAFDSVTEEQLRQIKRVFGTKQNKNLIFDETPYKKYIAKLESPVELSYVCFDEPIKRVSTTPRPGLRVIREKTIIDEETQEEITVPTWEREPVYPYELEEGTQRIYKGEGKISFICYFPFAKSVFKVLPEGSEEWAISSGILSAEEYVNIDSYNNGVINIYNAGDLPTGFRLFIPGAPSTDLSIINNQTGEQLVIEPFSLLDGDAGILINTDNQLIQGLKSHRITIGIDEETGDPIYKEDIVDYDKDGNLSYLTSGNIYNQFIKGGYFFKLEPNLKTDNATITIDGGIEGIKIFYDYLYY